MDTAMRARRCSYSRSVLGGEELVVEVRVGEDLGGLVVVLVVARCWLSSCGPWGSRRTRRRPHKRSINMTGTNGELGEEVHSGVDDDLFGFPVEEELVVVRSSARVDGYTGTTATEASRSNDQPNPMRDFRQHVAGANMSLSSGEGTRGAPDCGRRGSRDDRTRPTTGEGGRKRRGVAPT